MCPCCIRRPTGSSDDNCRILETAERLGRSDLPPNAFAESLLKRRLSRPKWIDAMSLWSLTKFTKYYESKAGVLKRVLFGRELKEASEKGFKELGRTFEIVELGIGTGPNPKFYSGPEIHVTGIDPNSASRSYAEASARDAGLRLEQFEFVEAVGEGIPLPDNSADAVVSSLVMCSVADLRRTLAEVHRVLRPGGRYYFLEHVAGPEGSRVRWWQNLLNPLQKLIFDNCHLTRDPVPVLKDVGFVLDARNVLLDFTVMFYLAPHLVGKGNKLT